MAESLKAGKPLPGIEDEQALAFTLAVLGPGFLSTSGARRRLGACWPGSRL
ncbi:MAG: hypothetical protein R3F43_23925 [bacterium]